MKLNKELVKSLAWKWLLVLVAIFLILIIASGVFLIYFEKTYENSYYPGTSIAGVNVEGLNRLEAEDLLNEKIDNMHEKGVIFSYLNEQARLDILQSAGADIAVPIALFDFESAIDEAFNYPRTEDSLTNFYLKYSLWKDQGNFPIAVNLNEEMVDDFFKINFSHFSTPAKNASLVSTSSPYTKEVEFGVSQEVYGQVLDIEKAKQKLREQLALLEYNNIELEATIELPEIAKKDVENIEVIANKYLDKAPIDLVYEDNSWTVSRDDLLNIMQIKKNEAGKIYIGLDLELGSRYLFDNIASEINIEAADAKFEIVDDRVEKFQPNHDGLELDLYSSLAKIEKVIATNTEEKIDLITKVIKSKDSTEEMENLGITEIIGVGHSNFYGSPANRVHNISVGAESVNGTLVAPGEEFSLLSVLGTIDGTTGYKQELVIKDNQTIAEYGGGLCQIGTTVFRGTVDSGLPVTMRRNHSYRVSYYEPAGTDATIYDPWPDYKFKNDTPSHVLILSRIEGTDLYFDFWGTNDGRVASATDPVIYNIKRPPPTKIIETLDLEPGVKRCTEHAHNGADAYFDYGVRYADGTQVNERFKSHYSPWQEVCLLGVEALSTSTEAVLSN